MKYLVPFAFGILAGVTLVNAWRDENLRAIGVALVFSYLVSNVASQLFFANMVFFETRVTIYSVIEVGVGAIAFMLLMTGGSKSMPLILGIAMVSVCANIAIMLITPYQGTPPLESRHLWNLVTNVCFTLECLTVVMTAVIARGRANRLRRRPSNARLLVARCTDPQGTDG